jgi:hypothetical protein
MEPTQAEAFPMAVVEARGSVEALTLFRDAAPQWTIFHDSCLIATRNPLDPDEPLWMTDEVVDAVTSEKKWTWQTMPAINTSQIRR